MQGENIKNKIKTALLIAGIMGIAVLYTILGYKVGYDSGFNACIEENNLYKLYNI